MVPNGPIVEQSSLGPSSQLTQGDSNEAKPKRERERCRVSLNAATGPDDGRSEQKRQGNLDGRSRDLKLWMSIEAAPQRET